MYKSSFVRNSSASRAKSRPRVKSAAERLPTTERTVSPDAEGRSRREASTVRAVAAASAGVVPASAAAAAAAESASEFPPKDYKDDVMKLCTEGFKKFLKFMPALPKSRQAEWDLPTLLSRCSDLYDSLDDRIRLIPSQPASLLQRKKTLACNIAWSVAPYSDVSGKAEKFEFNRLFGAKRDGPLRLTEQYVPDEVKARVAKLSNKKGGKAANSKTAQATNGKGNKAVDIDMTSD